MSKLPVVSINELLDAGMHFGHKSAWWNPKMAPYIYGIRNNVHIIDLQQTLGLLHVALNKIYETVKNNGKVLFIGTKIQASDLIKECAEKCGQHYVNHRWLGGMLTNWDTISLSINKLENFEEILSNEEQLNTYTKKEILDITRKKDKLLRSLGGIRQMHGVPALIVIIDTNKEHLAIQEAVKLGIPIVAVVDTNSDPDHVNFPIPGNDDAIRSIRLCCDLFAKAVLRGIEDNLIASGVDLGEVNQPSELGNTNQEIVKLKTPKRLSRTPDSSVGKPDDSPQAKEEFEAALKKNTVK